MLHLWMALGHLFNGYRHVFEHCFERLIAFDPNDSGFIFLRIEEKTKLVLRCRSLRALGVAIRILSVSLEGRENEVRNRFG